MQQQLILFWRQRNCALLPNLTQLNSGHRLIHLHPEARVYLDQDDLIMTTTPEAEATMAEIEALTALINSSRGHWTTNNWEGNYGATQNTVPNLTDRQRDLIVAALPRLAPTPAATLSRTNLIRAMCHAKSISCECADRGGDVCDYDACRIVSRHANAIISSIPAPAAEVTGERGEYIPELGNIIFGGWLEKQLGPGKTEIDRTTAEAVRLGIHLALEWWPTPSPDAGRVPDRWVMAEAMHEARIKLAWGQAWEGRRLPWPRSAKDYRAYPHNPVADIDLHLAAADAVIAMLAASPAHDEVKS
jgi:hypothetical protein